MISVVKQIFEIRCIEKSIDSFSRKLRKAEWDYFGVPDNPSMFTSDIQGRYFNEIHN
jgi:hypothetical protein